MATFEEYFAQSLIQVEGARREVKKLSDCLMRDHGWDIESDLRIRVFEQINNLMQPYSLTLLYGEKCISDDKWIARMLQPMSNKDVEGVRNTYEVFIRNAFILNFTSVVESCIRTFLRAVCPTNKAINDFSKVKFALFEALGNREPKDTKNALHLLFEIRNCIHNNGIHYSRTGNGVSIAYRGTNYIFKNGALQTFASMGLLLAVLGDLVEMFVFIVTHEKVKSLGVVQDEGK